MNQIVEGLHYDFEHFSMAGFREHLQNLTGRQLVFIEWDMPEGMFGAWISHANKPIEYIFFARRLPLIQQAHVQLHELGHFLCGHPTMEFTGGAGAGPDPLFRSDLHTSAMEIEAETLAALIQSRVIGQSRGNELAVSISSNEDTAAFLQALSLI